VISRLGVGLVSSAILIGLLVIFLGRMLYPEISITFQIGWVIFAGVLTGGVSGLYLHRSHFSFPADITITAAIGTIFFLLVAWFVSLPMGPTIVLGMITGGLTGTIIKVWTTLNLPKDTVKQNSN